MAVKKTVKNSKTKSPKTNKVTKLKKSEKVILGLSYKGIAILILICASIGTGFLFWALAEGAQADVTFGPYDNQNDPICTYIPNAEKFGDKPFWTSSVNDVDICTYKINKVNSPEYAFGTKINPKVCFYVRNVYAVSQVDSSLVSTFQLSISALGKSSGAGIASTYTTSSSDWEPACISLGQVDTQYHDCKGNFCTVPITFSARAINGYGQTYNSAIHILKAEVFWGADGASSSASLFDRITR